MQNQPKTQICELCCREVDWLTRHHLVPREEGGKYGPTAMLCQPCHGTIHLHLTNRELAVLYNTIPALQQAEPLQKYFRWIRTRSVNRLVNRRRKR